MAKRQSKYAQILGLARQRVDAAELKESAAREALWVASTEARIFRDAYDAFVKALTPKPRKNAVPKPAAAEKEPAKNDPIPPGLCSYKFPEGHECLAPASNAIHDKSMGYAGYHPFQSVAPLAARRSSRKSSVAASTANSETEKETVSAVGASAGD